MVKIFYTDTEGNRRCREHKQLSRHAINFARREDVKDVIVQLHRPQKKTWEPRKERLYEVIDISRYD